MTDSGKSGKNLWPSWPDRGSPNHLAGKAALPKRLWRENRLGCIVICAPRTTVAEVGTSFTTWSFLSISTDQRTRTSRENWTPRFQGRKRKGRRRCCVSRRQTTKHFKSRTCRSESKTGEARPNYTSPRAGLWSHGCKPLEQHARHASKFPSNFPTVLARQQRCPALDIRWRRIQAVCG